MFKFEVPVFAHKSLLKKDMLDELRDYPLQIIRMMLKGCGDGILKGTKITWENNILKVHSGLLVHEGNIYRMEEECALPCKPTGRLTFIKISFSTMDYGKESMGGSGNIYIDESPPQKKEMEIGRFLLQKGARLRTEYENFEDYQTEFDTLNKIHAPYICQGGVGVCPEILMTYANELLKTETESPYDISFAMQVLGSQGQCAGELVEWYIEKNMGKKMEGYSNLLLYEKLKQILQERKNGNTDWGKKQGSIRQMLLL